MVYSNFQCNSSHVFLFSVKFSIIGPSEPIITYVGEDVILPASLSPALNAEEFQVRWFTTDFRSPVILFENYQYLKQIERTKMLFKGEMKYGNVSLKIQNVRVSDNSVYSCYVDSGRIDDEVQITLVVEGQFLGSQPSISIRSSDDQQTRLECTAEKWNPQPEIVWRDMNGVDVTTLSTATSQQAIEGLLTVSSVIPVKDVLTVFTCLMKSKAAKPDWPSGLSIYSECKDGVELFSLTLGLISWLLHLLFLSSFFSSADVTFDPETANPWLIVSEDGKEVRNTDRRQRVTDSPKRFDRYPVVLAREGFTSGTHYWEVEVGEKTAWDLGVESVERKGRVTLSPRNGLWTVVLINENKYWANAGPSVPIHLRVTPQTVGVFLGYSEGQVSFYNAQSHSHLYTFTGSFTEPLYPYFSPCFNDNVKNMAPLIICSLMSKVSRTLNKFKSYYVTSAVGWRPAWALFPALRPVLAGIGSSRPP
uniref:B30.2/SPRY domain-containing protein n=1 Tax=Erpetoichthys calabaricus TaxID=27687 RepID=A0A8C4T3S9_ERPCA